MGKTTRRLLHALLTLVLLGAGAAGLAALTASKPGLERQKPSVQPPLVRTMEVKSSLRRVIIRGEGTVAPLLEISLVPQVAGKVIHVSPNLVNGGQFKKDELLLQLDPADYKMAVTSARASVRDLESKLKITLEESAMAKEEWRLHASNNQVNRQPPPLVAKEPQLAAAKAALEGAQANRAKAVLNLYRTEIKAPFDGVVSQKNVGLGQFVAAGVGLASIFATEAVEIVAPLPDRDLYWFHVPGFTPGEGEGSPAVVRASFAGRDMEWPGRVVRAEGKLDERSRMVRVVIRVDQPYARKPPLAVGMFVTVEIEGRSLERAVVIPRSALHEGNLVWVAGQDGRLRFREVEVARLSGDVAVVRAGLKDGETVIVSGLKAVTDGMKVRPAPLKEKGPS